MVGHLARGDGFDQVGQDGLEGPDDPDLPGFAYKEDQNWDESQISVTWEVTTILPTSNIATSE